MKRIIAATLFCATLAVPAVAQGPHAGATHGVPNRAEQMGAQTADLVPVPGAVAAPVGGAALYGGDMVTGKGSEAALLPSGPAPSIAWMLAVGFLGLVVLRRTRASNAF